MNWDISEKPRFKLVSASAKGSWPAIRGWALYRPLTSLERLSGSNQQILIGVGKTPPEAWQMSQARSGK